MNRDHRPSGLIGSFDAVDAGTAPRCRWRASVPDVILGADADGHNDLLSRITTFLATHDQ